MIAPEKVEEWIHEVEERPSSAPLIIRFITSRLETLTRRIEELRAENIELVSGRKVEEYERRIANLEYQLELLKRQVGSGALEPDRPAAIDTISLVLFAPSGRVLRVELVEADLSSAGVAASFAGEIAPDGLPPYLLATSTQEELLFVFDTGRTVTLPVTAIPAAKRDKLDWEQAYLQEPRASEELAVALPISRLPLYEFCIQTSRRAFVKKIFKSSLESYLANFYLGTGVKLQLDKMCSLVFGNKTDRYVMVSQEGFLFCSDVESLPVAIEDVLKLNPTDHIVSTFILNPKSSLLIATASGKALQRDGAWVEQSSSFKTRGQPAFSKERREAGTRVVGAACVGENDWGLVLRSDGKLVTYKMGDLFGSGSLLAGHSPVQVLGFTTFKGTVVEI